MILITTLLPSGAMPATTIWEFFSFDSFAHIFVFTVQAFLLIVGLLKQYTFKWLRFYAIRVSLLACTIYGVLIELIQEFFIKGRQGDMLDVVSDTVGALLGLALFHFIYKSRFFD